MNKLQRREVCLAALAAWAAAAARAADSDWLEGNWTDSARQQRAVPWRLYLPSGSSDLAWVVYSHGLGGSRLAGEDWGRHWAAQGIASLHLQHAGSDRGVLTQGGLRALQSAMNAEQLFQRVQDVRFALDQVQQRLGRSGEGPWRRLQPERVGVAGHSFGAVTTQALAGQRYAPAYAPSPLQEPRFKAALAFSPSLRRGDPEPSFGACKLPFLSVTGTEDSTLIVQDVPPANRVLPYEGLPAGHKYLLVFAGAGHASLSGSKEGRMLDGQARVTERIRPLIQQASTWFWQAHLLGDAQALQWLRELPRHVKLDAGDTFRAG